MGPKKDAKNAIEEPPKEVEPEPLPYEIEGYGRFQYLNGTAYEGGWKIVKGAKVKQGYGKLTLPVDLQNGAGEEYYQGNWEDDKMAGFGTYYYPDGSVYSGEWLNNKHHGRGRFNLANGTSYEGIWQQHLMHGSGCFFDHLGRKWDGEFREGVYESRKQMELSKEKVLEERRSQAKQEIRETIAKMMGILEKEEQPQHSIALFFPSSDQVKTLIKGQLSAFALKGKEAWIEILKQAHGGDVRILQHRADCKTIDGERLLVRQQQGEGQAVEVFFSKGGKKCSLLFLQIEKSRWVLASTNEDLN